MIKKVLYFLNELFLLYIILLNIKYSIKKKKKKKLKKILSQFKRTLL